MFELPLFPLHTVLFPHTPLQLHIFEERYQRMMEMCLQEKRPFGVVLIRRGAEALGPLAEPHQVGCTAEIITTQPLGGGRLNLVAVGDDRFRILRLDTQSHPFLSGQVELIPWHRRSVDALPALANGLRAQVQRYLGRLNSVGGQTVYDPQKLPEDPFELACLSAAVLDIDPAQKQALLESDSVDDLIDRLQAIYRREAALIQAMIQHTERGSPDFSNN